MAKRSLGKAGLAAVILLAPGGFILGAALAARYLRDRARASAGPGQVESATEAVPSAPEEK